MYCFVAGRHLIRFIEPSYHSDSVPRSRASCHPASNLSHTAPLNTATFLSGGQRYTRPIEHASAQAGWRPEKVQWHSPKVIGALLSKQVDKGEVEAEPKKKDKTQVARSGPHRFHTLGAMVKRKFDAVTAPLELRSRPTYALPFIVKLAGFHGKILQLLHNNNSICGETPTADYRLGFGVMNATAYLILNHESVHVVQLTDCWGTGGRADSFASLANIIPAVHLPSAGFSRFFSHEYLPTVA
ncbi:BZ3500_MvSof-1268-A1-R1_Chr9g10845 [Microbotryum saponariae]|uniref:BZ3500_MvSof-1268-A1-R1_Chr9g10845 protein n=1 Tax=Microbotryum saponariae TaxID=289078 RepID=A0A2X0KVY6_9BASI|nr:BZ3501_MvSof-1269-A2-R1_Chr9g10593 [Microbotryum saponariae]SDA00796.1 BZ3500_MvSof-1268-A1-R1_Chr9g10845 [Microbotryum saponariae]